MLYKFSEIAENSKEKRMPLPEDKYNYIGLEHLDTGDLTVHRWGSDVDIKGEKLVMHKGDLLFGRRNTYLRRVAIAPHDGLFSAHGMILHPNPNVIDSSFFPFFIASDYFMDAAIRISVGSLSPTVNWSTLKELEFRLPSFDKQKELAQLLWGFERARQAYKRLLLESDKLVKSQFVEMFGDPVKNKRSWPLIPLQECLYGIDSGKSLNCESHPRSGELPAVLKLSAVTYGEYNPDENKELPTADEFIPELEVHVGDLLFSRKNTREYVGMTAIVRETPKKLMLPDLIFRLLPRECIRAEYLHQLINHPQYRPVISELASGTAGSMPNISKQRLLALEIPLPPVELQTAFEPIVQQTDKSKLAIRQALESLEKSRNAIMAQVFG